MSILLAGTMLLGTMSAASAAIKDFMTAESIPSTYAEDIDADIAVKKSGDSTYSDDVRVETSSVAGLTTFDFVAILDMQGVKDAFEKYISKAEAKINAKAEEADKAGLLAELSAAAVTGEFTITVTNVNAMTIPEEIKAANAGFNAGIADLFTETARTYEDDVMTITLAVKEGTTATTLEELFAGEVEDLTLTCTGVSVSDFGTYKMSGAVTGTIKVGDNVETIDVDESFASITFNAVQKGDSDDLSATVSVQRPTSDDSDYVGAGGSTSPSTPSTGKTETVTNPDGSTTTTVTDNKTGTVTKTTKETDGTTTTVETKKDGTVTTTEKDTEGNTTTTVENTDGSSTVTEKNTDGSEKVIEKATDGTTTTTEKDAEGNKTETVAKVDGSSVTTEERTDGTTVKTETTAAGETTAEIKAEAETEVVIPVEDAEKVLMMIVTDESGKKTYITEVEAADKGVAVSVGGNATVNVKSGEKKEFEDVHHVEHWSEDSVNFVYVLGLMNGTSDNHFSPEANLTRAMLVTILYRAEGEPEAISDTAFEDVVAGSYYEKAVAWAQANGIVKGISDTAFAPDSHITREQIAAIMHRYAEHKGYDVAVGETNIHEYDDAHHISDYAVDAMHYAVDSGLINGKTETTLNPADNATRAEAATILERFIRAN